MGRFGKILLLVSAALLLGVVIYVTMPDSGFIGVVVEDEQDDLRISEYLNGIQLIAGQNGDRKVRVLHIQDDALGRREASEFARQKGCMGILTTLSYPEEFAPVNKMPVLTTGETKQAISMSGDERDEVTALLHYVEEVNVESVVIMIPEGSFQSEFSTWISRTWQDRIFTYGDEMLGIEYEFSDLTLDRIGGILIWGDETQVPGLIKKLRHSGYTGVLLGPSFLEEYDVLGINAGQASGLFFASQYLNAKKITQSMGVRQQEFVQEYTKHYEESPLFRECFLGADQMLLALEMIKNKDVKEMRGVVQVYDYNENERTGNVDMVVYEIRSGYMEEAR